MPKRECVTPESPRRQRRRAEDPFSVVLANRHEELAALTGLAECVNSEDETLVDFAAARGKEACLRVLADAGCPLEDIDETSGMAAVHWAADSLAEGGGDDDPACLAFLRGRGCDLEKRSRIGATAAHYAAMNGFVNKLAFLHASGCDLRARSHGGKTPLALAAKYGHGACVDFLTAA